MCVLIFFFKQKTAYEMRISDWSSDVCSSDLAEAFEPGDARLRRDVGRAAAIVGLAAFADPHHGEIERMPVALALEVAEIAADLHDAGIGAGLADRARDRKSTRLNSSH